MKNANSVGREIWLFVGFSIAVGHGAALLLVQPPLTEMIAANSMEPGTRQSLVIATVVITILSMVFLFLAGRASAHHNQTPTVLNGIEEVARRYWPLTLLALVPYVLSTTAWQVAPIFLFAICSIFALVCVSITQLPTGLVTTVHRHFQGHPTLHLAALFAMIAAYATYVSFHTVIQHYSLGTSAYDLGIIENVFWNSVHGDLFASSIEIEGNHLGVHTSFVFLLLFPLYAVIPRPETLLISQAVLLALAAWPLFLLARSSLRDDTQALIISAIYLAHPAVAGANFYDFHELAFTPILLFSAFFFLRTERLSAYWVAVVLLLSVKEDMTLVVVLVGAAAAMSGKRNVGLTTIAVGISALLFFQFAVIPHFAGAHHDYSWYYADMIPPDSGPTGLLSSLVSNPVFSFRYMLSSEKNLYLFQLLAPLAFMSFLSIRGITLMSYGLLASVLASRPALFQLGFQYSLTLVASALVGMLIVLEKWNPSRRAKGLTVAVILSLITCYQYGMVYPKHNFAAGFLHCDFELTPMENERYQEVKAFVKLIPDHASVTASETLVPHVARRKEIETVRYATTKPGRFYDYYFLLLETASIELQSLPEVASLQGYEVVKKGTYCVLLRRRG